MKKTVGVSVFPVGFSGGMKFEGPVCSRNGSVVKWKAYYAPNRYFNNTSFVKCTILITVKIILSLHTKFPHMKLITNEHKKFTQSKSL